MPSVLIPAPNRNAPSSATSRTEPVATPSTDPETTTHLNSLSDSPEQLLNQHGASDFIHWKIAEGGTLKVLRASSQVADFVVTNAQDLVARALRAKEQKTCLLSSPSLCLLVAQPFQDLPDECLSVVFPCELTGSYEQAAHERIDAVQRYVVDLERRRQSRPAGPAAEKPVQQSSDAQATDAQATDAAVGDLPTWRDLLVQGLHRTKACLREQASHFKAYLIGLVVIVGIGLIPWPHAVDCNVVCEPVSRRYIAAPFDARLLRSHVMAGEKVYQGQVLATMDGSEIRTELAVLRTKLGQAEQRQLAALSTGDHSKAELERLETTHLQRQIELFENRQSHLEIRSPINGVVVAGDLERSEGAPLSAGDNLFEIASLDRLIAEVAIPEQQVSCIEDTMEVTVRLDAMPGQPERTTLQRIHLRSEIRDNANVFIAEAELANPHALLRPGMSGTASIHAGYRALGWILFHQPYNAVRHWNRLVNRWNRLPLPPDHRLSCPMRFLYASSFSCMITVPSARFSKMSDAASTIGWDLPRPGLSPR